MEGYISQFDDSEGSLVPYDDKFPCYIPESHPIDIEETDQTIEKLTEAWEAIDELSSLLDETELPPHHYLYSRQSMSTVRFNGFNLSIDDILSKNTDEFDDLDDPIKFAVYKNIKVINAIRNERDLLAAEGKFTMKLIHALHSELLIEDKDSAKFRSECAVYGEFENPEYIPAHPDSIEKYMPQIIDSLNGNGYNNLVSIMLAHYQLWAVQPYKYSNNYVNHVLTTLQFERLGVLPLPVLDMATYFNENSEEYEQRLIQVSTNNDWEGWIVFFANGIIERVQETIQALEQYQDELEDVANEYPSSEVHKMTYLTIVMMLTSTPDQMDDLTQGDKENIENAVDDLVEDGYITQLPKREEYMATIVKDGLATL